MTQCPHIHHTFANFVIFQYCVLMAAHDDSIWTVAWGTNEKDGMENVLTGAVDDMVKCWRW